MSPREVCDEEFRAEYVCTWVSWFVGIGIAAGVAVAVVSLGALLS